MPTLNNHALDHPVRILGMGDPGTGKTGSLANLINALPRWGIEQVIIQDWDDGLDILSFHVKPDKMQLVHYATLSDELKATQEGVKIRKVKAFPSGMGLMNNWQVGKEGEPGYENLGNANSWGKETIFICDTLTGLGDACMNYAIGTLNIDDDWKATGAAMKLQGKYVQLLRALNCHIILFSHVRFIGGGGQIVVQDQKQASAGVSSFKVVDSAEEGKAFPSALGRILPPTIGRHFNVQLEWCMKGTHRKISTVPRDDKMATKSPVKLQDYLSQETGLVDVFSAYLDR